MLITFISFGVLGMLAQVAFGGARELVVQRNWGLKGQTSLWMLPLYGMVAIFYPPVAIRVSEMPWYGRALVYGIAISVVQLVVGLVLSRFSRCPWHYDDKWTIKGIVSLPYFPLWCAFGLGVEWVWPKIKAISLALS